ncbi:MAG: hypothetical protein ACRDUV_25870 [Pseudonocardiaceae bacterium]
MPTIGVAGRDEDLDDELPPKFLIFTSPDLDQNEDKACEAGAEIESILRGIIRHVCDLEHIERALRESEPASARARRTRESLLSAISESDGLVVGLGNAWDALTFDWHATTTPAAR